MGCDQSTPVKTASVTEIEKEVPSVPSDSWYAQPFSEATSMQLSAFQAANRGRVLVGTEPLPASDKPCRSVQTSQTTIKSEFRLGHDQIYGMGYFHNTALFIEYRWRPRIAFRPEISNRFSRPFYDMLLGVKIIIDGQLVPDRHPFAESLTGCTASIRAHEATTTWLCCPLVLDGDCRTAPLRIIRLYRGMMASFLCYAMNLEFGRHDVRIDCVYGVKAENGFVTDFISTGTFVLNVDADSRRLCVQHLQDVTRLISTDETPELYVSLDAENPPSCPTCGTPLKYGCTICGAAACGSPQCVWEHLDGYPTGCRSHRTVMPS